MIEAECLDDFPGSAEIVPWHHGEQMMFYLIIQAAVPEISNWSRFYVSCGEHLRTQEIQGFFIIQNQHSLVIRSEDCAVVQAKQTLMDYKEAQHLPGTQKAEEQTEI